MSPFPEWLTKRDLHLVHANNYSRLILIMFIILHLANILSFVVGFNMTTNLIVTGMPNLKIGPTEEAVHCMHLYEHRKKLEQLLM